MASIPLVALGVQQPPAVLDQYGKIAQISELLNQQKLLPGQLQEQQQDIQAKANQNQVTQLQLNDQQAMTKAMRAWDGQDINDLPGLILKQGGSANAVFGMKNQLLDYSTKLQALTSGQLANEGKKADVIAGHIDNVGIGAAQGAGSVAMHEGGTTQGVNASDVALGAGIGAAAPAVEGAISGAANSKLARGFINQSVMAAPRDVIYGNPAKALLDENIATLGTGDLEKFKDAVRSGSTLQGAADAAGGRIAAVSDRINQIAPQLRATLAASTTKIPVSVVTDPIDNGIQQIMASRGVTAQEAQTAIGELNAIKQAALKIPSAPGATATSWAPLEANTVKQEIGADIDWAGRERIGQLVDPVRKQVYGGLRDAVNQAAPGAANLNERLTNLLAAQTDINKLAGFEEVGRGRSLGGVIGPSWMGRAEALAGRVIPAINWLSPVSNAAIKAGGVPAVTQANAGVSRPLSSLFGSGNGQ